LRKGLLSPCPEKEKFRTVWAEGEDRERLRYGEMQEGPPPFLLTEKRGGMKKKKVDSTNAEQPREKAQGKAFSSKKGKEGRQILIFQRKKGGRGKGTWF